MEAITLKPHEMKLQGGAFVADWDAMEQAARAYAAQFDSIEITDERSRKDAAKVRADINDKKKQLNRARIDLSKEYDKPKAEFKARVDGIIAILDEQIGYIDGQLKAKDAEHLEARRRLLSREYEAMAAGLMEAVPLDRFIAAEPKLAGRTWTGSKACDKLDEMVQAAAQARATLAEQNLEFPLDADRVFCETLSMQAALDENARLAQRRRDNEARAAAMPEAIRPQQQPQAPAQPPLQQQPPVQPAQAAPKPEARPEPLSRYQFTFVGTESQAAQVKSLLVSLGVTERKMARCAYER